MNRFHRQSICWFMCPALFLLGACSASEAPGEESQTFVPVQISGVALHTEVATRANTPLTSGRIGVFSTTVAYGYNQVFNAEYTYNSSESGSGSWSSVTPITVAGYTAELCAYHPYGAASFVAGSTVFDLSAQLYSAAQDLSYAPISEDTQADNLDVDVSFAMKRGYAQLSLAITRKAGYTGGACKISNVSLKNPSDRLQSVRTLDISSGVYTDKTDLETLSFTNLGTLQNTGITSGTTDKSLHLLLPPQSLGGLHLLLTIDGVVHSLAIASAYLDKWEAGKNYEVKVSVNDTGVSVGSVSTKEWVDNEIDGGTTPGTPAPPYVVLPTIGLRVAKGNLMREADRGRWYLAPDQGYYTGDANGDDYHAWDGPTLNAGCVAVLGAGWRLPTKTENEGLAGMQKKWGSYRSQRGLSNGYYFGITNQPDAANQDDYAFLPAAGYRNVDGGMSGAGSSGNYWSSEPDGGYYSYYLYFYSSSISGSNTSSNRFSGPSVRCVADN